MSLHYFVVALVEIHLDLPSHMVTRPFLLSLWWRELALLAVLMLLAVLAMAWIALRVGVSDSSTIDSNPVKINKRLKELTEKL